MANERSSDEQTEAKLAYVHINSKDIKDGSILSLLIKDTDSIEVYGIEAERAAKSNNLPLVRVNGVPELSFPNTRMAKKPWRLALAGHYSRKSASNSLQTGTIPTKY